MAKQMSEIEIMSKLRGKLHSSQISSNAATMAIQICKDGHRPTDKAIVKFLIEQGFAGRGIEKIMGVSFEWMVKDFRPMTEYERLTM